ncbi:MAG TPA: ABC transporter permease [Candidatus Acidoferrales bacterium]|nr:ABC transporter permease [Candidatus Acidoferrales bacterium]
MSIWNDVRYGARALVKSPGFAITAVLTMAFGIGATTAIFSVSDAMLWKPVPLPRLDSLTMVLQRIADDPRDFNAVTTGDLADIRRENTSLEDIAFWGDGLANIVGSGGEPERVAQYLVSTNFFDVIGVRPARGRGFLAGEDEPGREREVVLSNPLWRRRFGADPGIVGRNIRLDDMDYLVVGVMPPKFEFPKTAELWTPWAIPPASRNARSGFSVMAAGHLKPGRTLAQFSSELDGIAGRLAKQYPDTNRNRRFMAWDAHRFMIGEYSRQYVLMLLGAVLFVLLIACVNVANLQFARATGRLREVAVRTALGASRGQIVTQLVTESVLLAVAGGSLGLTIAAWGVQAIRDAMPPDVEKYIVGWDQVRLDGRALLFTLLAAVASGLLAGLAPAWQSSRPNLTNALREGGRGTSAGRGRHRLRNLLVGAEVALAVVLLVGASLMVRGFGSLAHAATNLEPSTLLTLRLALTETKYKEPHQRQAFYSAVLDRVRSIPGVRSAVAVSAVPYSDHSSGRAFTVEGRVADPANPVTGMYQLATPGFFETLHIPLRAGRFLDARDGRDAPRTAVISERAARRYWPNEPYPLGKHIKASGPNARGEWITIVGVAGDIMHDVFDRNPRPVFYLPYTQDPRLWMDIAVRSAGDPLRLQPAVIAAVRAVDPEQPVTNVRTMDTLMRNQAMGLIYVAVLMGVFGALALALSCIGVYGVMAYLVEEQTHEIGIRMALGAHRESVLAMIFRRGMLTTALGLVAGLPLAYALAMLMQGLIFGVTATDPVTFTGIPLALLASAALALYIPARRAMRIDPIVALRYE